MKTYVDVMDMIRHEADELVGHLRSVGARDVDPAEAIAANVNSERLRERAGAEWAPDVDRLLLREVTMRLSPLYQGPKSRAARRVQICPESEEQVRRWDAAAAAAGLTRSAWLVRAAEEKLARG